MSDAPIKPVGTVTITDGYFDNWFVITDANGQRINNADIEGDRDEMLMIALAIEERRPAGESFKRCAVWPEGDGFGLQSPRNSTRHTWITLEQASDLARDIRLRFAQPATTLALEAQTVELARLREEVATWRRVDSETNAALNRAGIYCAITFAEAIDQIRSARDEARAALHATEQECEILRSLGNGAASGSRPSSGVSQAAYDRLKAENAELRQQLEMATGPHCSSCGNSIDPDCCWCGEDEKSHRYEETHGFIPMGCDCARTDRDWKKLATALREQLWRERKAAR